MTKLETDGPYKYEGRHEGTWPGTGEHKDQAVKNKEQKCNRKDMN